MKKKNNAKKEIFPVNVKDDALMVSLGIRLPNYEYPSFYKTNKEKELLKKLRTKHNDFVSAPKIITSHIPHKFKLIVYTRRSNSNFNHNTYSYKCYDHQVSEILRNLFPDHTKENCIIVKYQFNGRTYKPNPNNYTKFEVA